MLEGDKCLIGDEFEGIRGLFANDNDNKHSLSVMVDKEGCYEVKILKSYVC